MCYVQSESALVDMPTKAHIPQGSTQSKLHGVKRLSPAVKWFAAVSAAVAPLPESFMYEVSKDERVAIRVDVLERVCLDELTLLYTVRKSTWQRLAYRCGSALHTQRLTRDCLAAAQVAMAFLAHRVFSEARALPWSLCYGDMDKNLQELLDDEEDPSDPTAWKIRRLLEMDDGQGFHFQAFSRIPQPAFQIPAPLLIAAPCRKW